MEIKIGALHKTRMCPSLFSKAGCHLPAAECRYAHDKSELRTVDHIYYKVTPCAFYQLGKCRNGDMCTFAHGEQDMKPVEAAQAQTSSTDCGSSDYFESGGSPTSSVSGGGGSGCSFDILNKSLSYAKLQDGLALSINSSYED